MNIQYARLNSFSQIYCSTSSPKQNQILTQYCGKTKCFPLLTQHSPPHLSIPRLDHLLFAQIANSSLGRSQRKVPGLGLGLVLGIHLRNWRVEEKGELGRMPLTGTPSQLLQCFFFHHFISVLFIRHSSFLYIFISYSISQPSSYFPPSSPAHTTQCAVMVCGDGLGCYPPNTKRAWLIQEPKRPAQTESERENVVFYLRMWDRKTVWCN